MGILTTKLIDFVLLLVFTLSYMCVPISGASGKLGLASLAGIDKELLLTRDEKFAFDKFKRVVYPHLFREDLKHDLFLLRWLRAKNLNVDVALNDFIGLKNYYFDNKVEHLPDEDWSDFEHDFPVHMDTYDRTGRPVGYLYLREGWDLRAAMFQGKRKRLQMYLTKIVFDLMIKVRDAHLVNRNVTQFVVLINLDGFSLTQQGCPQCINSLISMLTIYERFLPGFSHEIIIVEAPITWKLFYQAIRPVLSAHTREVIKFFDTNKRQWVEYIHERIDPKQLPHYFGGTKPE